MTLVIDYDAHPHVIVAVDQDVVHLFDQFGAAWCQDDGGHNPEETLLADGGTPAENGMGDVPGDWPWCDTCLTQGREEGALVDE